MRMMLLGEISSRMPSGACCRRQRFRSAIATAFFASACPTMYRSSSATICFGVRSASRARVCSVRLEGMELGTGDGDQGTRIRQKLNVLCPPFPVPSRLQDMDIRVRIHADLASDSQAALDDLLWVEIGVRDQCTR